LVAVVSMTVISSLPPDGAHPARAAVELLEAHPGGPHDESAQMTPTPENTF
jgi:hypothetical protein